MTPGAMLIYNSLMRPLCGGLTIDMKQGPVTGTLGEMGLTNAEVYKLE